MTSLRCCLHKIAIILHEAAHKQCWSSVEIVIRIIGCDVTSILCVDGQAQPKYMPQDYVCDVSLVLLAALQIVFIIINNYRVITRLRFLLDVLGAQFAAAEQQCRLSSLFDQRNKFAVL